MSIIMKIYLGLGGKSLIVPQNQRMNTNLNFFNLHFRGQNPIITSPGKQRLIKRFNLINIIFILKIMCAIIILFIDISLFILSVYAFSGLVTYCQLKKYLRTLSQCKCLALWNRNSFLLSFFVFRAQSLPCH